MNLYVEFEVTNLNFCHNRVYVMPHRKGKLEELHCPPQTLKNTLVMFDILRTYTAHVKL